MISTLSVENIALIEKAEISFTKGLNIISGETGSGKSILIDSLNFVLGDRADKSLIRHNSEKAIVEVVFTNINNKEALECINDFGIDFDGEIIINRMMSIAGKNECRINGKLVTVSQIRKIVSLLVDVHLQHQNQFLLNEQNHITIFDEYIGESFLLLKEQYRKLLSEYNYLSQDIKSYGDKNSINIEIDILTYQINEIESANLTTDDEEEQLIDQRNFLQNQEQITLLLNDIINSLDYNSDFSSLYTLNSSLKHIKALEKYTNKYLALYNRLESSIIEIEDIVSEFRNSFNEFQISTDINSLNGITQRLDKIRMIKKKYGKNIHDIKSYLDKSKNRLKKLENADNDLKEKETNLNNVFQKLNNTAEKMHILRTENSSKFSKDIVLHLKDLDMKNVMFEVLIKKPSEVKIDSFHTNGYNEVSFNISPNLGEPLRNLSKIASGGEMSRLMVGLKNITADFEHIDTLVLDEIDTGISGYVAKTVAKKLFNIALNHQVISVTHLPQIVAMADTHFLITKHSDKTSTFTTVSKLDNNESIKEIMRLAGSDKTSTAGFKNASELKMWANQYKDTTK